MSVTVDRQTLHTEKLGLQTVGQVLSHLQRENRLVVNLLIDGKEPDLTQLSGIRRSPVTGQTLYIETAQPGEMALEVLDDVQIQLSDGEQFKSDAAELLQENQVARAMEKLGAYFTAWQSAQESVMKVSQLLRIDLESVRIDERQSIAQILGQFTDRLREIKQCLMDRDYVLLTDLLLYETAQTYDIWIAVLDSIRGLARG